MRIGASFILASLVIFGGASAAAARPAATTYLANMRTGPGVGYPVVAAIPQGSIVDMASCAKSWCRVTWNGVSGYVSAGLLTQRIAAPIPEAAPADDVDPNTYRYIYGGRGPYFCDPYFDPYCNNYLYWDGGGWYWYDQRRRRWRPHPGPHPGPRPPHGQVRPRPDLGPPGNPPRFIPGRPPTPPRGTPGVIGRPGGGPMGGGAIGGPRGGGGPIGGPSGGSIGGSRGGGGGGFSGGGGGGGLSSGAGSLGGGGGHGGGGFGPGR